MKSYKESDVTESDLAEFTNAVMDAVTTQLAQWDSELFIPLSIRFGIAERILQDDRVRALLT